MSTVHRAELEAMKHQLERHLDSSSNVMVSEGVKITSDGAFTGIPAGWFLEQPDGETRVELVPDPETGGYKLVGTVTIKLYPDDTGAARN